MDFFPFDAGVYHGDAQLVTGEYNTVELLLQWCEARADREDARVIGTESVDLATCIQEEAFACTRGSVIARVV